MRNIGTLDRLLRIIAAEVCVLAAFFWVSKEWQIVLYLLAAVLLFQAATGVCGFYNLLGWNTCENIKRKDKNLLPIALMIIMVVAVAGIYGSAVLTRDIFLNDILSIEGPYNLTMQYTEKGLKAESVGQYEQLLSAVRAFEHKYSDYRPLIVKFDDGFAADMQNLSAIVSGSGEDIYNGSLKAAHNSLQRAEPVLQRMKEPDSFI